MEKCSDDKFTFYFIAVMLLIITAIMTGSILRANPLTAANLMAPSVFGALGLIFVIGTYVWSIRIRNSI